MVERRTVKPIIKWPGGKSREFPRVSEYLLPARTWVEPFLGGGAFFFLLEPERACLNDASSDLIAFYRSVRDGDDAFRDRLLALARDRVALSKRAHQRAGGFAEAVLLARNGRPDRELPFALAAANGEGALDLPVEDLDEMLATSVTSKIRRLLGLESKHGKIFGPDELPDHFETALQAGYYTAVRDRIARDHSPIGRARFFFLRQLCYGSMFRYGPDGRFNIPYGGISYNRVSLAERVERLFSDEVRGLLGRAAISCADFEDHLRGNWDLLGDDAFVFLDPPYDTEFSNYANRGFGRPEQERLAALFFELPCPALLVIQRTEFVEGLYEGARFRKSYGKTYGYNVRGRNERQTTHLLIGNYEPA